MTDGQRIRTTVTIHGENYTITGTETTEHMTRVASKVDQKMREISSINLNLNTSKVAVLTAVNAVHDYVKLLEQYEQLEKELLRLKD